MRKSTPVKELSTHMNHINSNTLYSSPNSHTDPFAIFQHKLKSSLTFPNLRALFCPRWAFFCSLVIFPPRPPDPRGSRESRASRCCPRSPVVEPSAASSSTTVPGLARAIKNLGSTVRLFLCENRKTYSDFTGAVPAGYGRRGMTHMTKIEEEKCFFQDLITYHVIDARVRPDMPNAFFSTWPPHSSRPLQRTPASDPDL